MSVTICLPQLSLQTRGDAAHDKNWQQAAPIKVTALRSFRRLDTAGCNSVHTRFDPQRVKMVVQPPNDKIEL
jgi:hypothetical protein